jgi:hypothetical protein
VDLQPLAWDVLEDHLGALEGHPRATRQQRAAGPPLAVALQLQPQRGEAGPGERPARGDPVDHAEHAAHVEPPRPAEPARERLVALVLVAVGDVGVAVDPARSTDPSQLGERAAPGGDGTGRARRRDALAARCHTGVEPLRHHAVRMQHGDVRGARGNRPEPRNDER